MPHAVLFFTRRTSLAAWREAGMLSRELALYARLLERGFRVTFVTYGGPGDEKHVRDVPGIRVVCNRWNLSESQYCRLLTTVYPSLWGRRVVIKSNQVLGADVALRAARQWRRPFVARCGYLHADFAERSHGPESTKAKEAARLERTVFCGATRVSVTTEAMADRISGAYGLNRNQIAVIPNYVDTRLFSPAPAVRDGERTVAAAASKPRIVFVGRLTPQKNLHALLDAVAGLNVELLIVGHDALMEDLRLTVNARQLPVAFLGNVPNDQVPALLRSADLFVLPSLYEGHPKVLLEAMACGLAVLGTNVVGTRELIAHGQTGWLCGVTPEELRASIQHLLQDQPLRQRLGKAARRHVVENYSLDQIVDAEAELLCEAAAARS